MSDNKTKILKRADGSIYGQELATPKSTDIDKSVVSGLTSGISSGVTGAGLFALGQAKKFTEPSFLVGLANSIGQGVTFGTLDEGIAAIASIGGYDYKDVRDSIRENLDEFRAEEPAYAFGAEIGASLLATGGAGALARGLTLGATSTGAKEAFKSLAKTAADRAKKSPVKAAGVAGALYGAGAAKEIEDVPASALLGGTMGMGGQALAPQISRGAQALKSKIPLTVGQLYGGGLKRAEEAAQSIPMIGSGIRAQREKATEAFSPFILSRALKPIGVSFDKNMKPQEAFKKAKNEFTKRYNKLLDSVDVEITDEILTGFGSAIDNAKTSLGATYKNQASDLEMLVMRNLIDKSVNGKVSGKALKDLQSKLSKKRTTALAKNELDLADAYDDVETAILDVFAKNSPQSAKELKNLNKAYFNYIPIRRAMAQSDEAVITPARLKQAISAEERKSGAAGLSRLAAGEARLQSPVELAKKVIGSEVGDSGTSERQQLSRFLTGATLTGAGAGGAGYMGQDPLIGAGASLAFGLLGRGAYTPVGQAAIRDYVMPTVSGALRSPATAGILGSRYAPDVLSNVGISPAQAAPVEDVYTTPQGQRYGIRGGGSSYTLLGE